MVALGSDNLASILHVPSLSSERTMNSMAEVALSTLSIISLG